MRFVAQQRPFLPDGRCTNERLLSKIRTGERGADYARAQLMAAGADRRMLDESPGEWLARLRTEGFLRPLRHPGNLAFTWQWGQGSGLALRTTDSQGRVIRAEELDAVRLRGPRGQTASRLVLAERSPAARTGISVIPCAR